MDKIEFESCACDSAFKVHLGKWSDDWTGRSEWLSGEQSDADVCNYCICEKTHWKAECPAI